MENKPVAEHAPSSGPTNDKWIDTELWNFAHALALDLGFDPRGSRQETSIYRSMRAAILAHSVAAGAPSSTEATRFADSFDDAGHPFGEWWKAHGQYMMSGGGSRERIWAARGWIAREQLACGVEVTGDSLHESRPVDSKGEPTPKFFRKNAGEWFAMREHVEKFFNDRNALRVEKYSRAAVLNVVTLWAIEGEDSKGEPRKPGIDTAVVGTEAEYRAMKASEGERSAGKPEEPLSPCHGAPMRWYDQNGMGISYEHAAYGRCFDCDTRHDAPLSPATPEQQFVAHVESITGPGVHSEAAPLSPGEWIDAERKRYEVWAISRGIRVEHWIPDPRVYVTDTAQDSWNGWKARALAGAGQVEGLVKALERLREAVRGKDGICTCHYIGEGPCPIEKAEAALLAYRNSK